MIQLESTPYILCHMHRQLVDVRAYIRLDFYYIHPRGTANQALAPQY